MIPLYNDVLYSRPVIAAETLTPAVLLACCAGLLFGSFLNVCIARLPKHRSIVRPPSHCPRCHAPIRPWENIPLVSFVLLRGRCRACRVQISLRYPLVELGLGLLWALAVYRFGWTAQALEAAVSCFLMLGLLVMDAETMRLPDSFTLPGIALGALQFLLPGAGLYPVLDLRSTLPFPAGHELAPWIAAMAAALGAAGLLFAIRAIYRVLRKQEGMGMGDIKLAALLGVWLGPLGVALALALGILSAGLGGIVLLVRRGSGIGPHKLPLGSFLCAGGLATVFLGRPILAWYFHFWL